MNDQLIIIRESTRSQILSSRKSHRNADLDSIRNIEGSCTPEVIRCIANKLKIKSAVKVQDLVTLKNGLLAKRNNSDIFLQTHGALRGLIRELTGNDTEKQSLAAACCCNLALGSHKSCRAVAKAAGSYLVTCVGSFNRDLSVPCIWSLGNLAGSDIQVCELLISQGALSSLIGVLSNGTDLEVESAVEYSLMQFIYTLKNDLSADDVAKILKSVSKLRKTADTRRLLFLLSCHSEFVNVQGCDESMMLTLVHDILSVSDTGSKTDFDVLKYSIQTLANVCCTEQNCNEVLTLLVEFKCTEFLRSLSLNVKLKPPIFWLLGNLYNQCADSQSKNVFFHNFLQIISTS